MDSADGKSNARSTTKVSVSRRSVAHPQKAGVNKGCANVLTLNTGFRDRLIGRLDQAGIPAHARTAYLAALTERAAQTVCRWLDRQQPGLPDLASCERLCRHLPCSADWMLGLQHPGSVRSGKRPGPAGPAGSVAVESTLAILDEMTKAFIGCEPMRMRGDEMSPRIRDGDLLFVDRAADGLAGNGVYALELDGRTMIRTVESRIGAGMVFRCENPAYQPCVVKDAAAARRMGLRVLGRVTGAIGAQWLMNG